MFGNPAVLNPQKKDCMAATRALIDLTNEKAYDTSIKQRYRKKQDRVLSIN